MSFVSSFIDQKTNSKTKPNNERHIREQKQVGDVFVILIHSVIKMTVKMSVYFNEANYDV